jgi:intein/homing endonuclease
MESNVSDVEIAEFILRVPTWVYKNLTERYGSGDGFQTKGAWKIYRKIAVTQRVH